MWCFPPNLNWNSELNLEPGISYAVSICYHGDLCRQKESHLHNKEHSYYKLNIAHYFVDICCLMDVFAGK